MIVRQPRRSGALVGTRARRRVAARARAAAAAAPRLPTRRHPTRRRGDDATTTEADAAGAAERQVLHGAGRAEGEGAFRQPLHELHVPAGRHRRVAGLRRRPTAAARSSRPCKYGEASDYIDVTASDKDGNWSDHGLRRRQRPTTTTRSSTQTETWKGGEQVTIVFSTERPDTSGQPPARRQRTSRSSRTTRHAGRLVVQGRARQGRARRQSASAVQYVDKDGAWVGRPRRSDRPACSASATPRTSRTNIGGTSLVQLSGRPRLGQLRAVPERARHVHGHAGNRPDHDRRRGRLAHARVRVRPRQADRKLLVLPVDD